MKIKLKDLSLLNLCRIECLRAGVLSCFLMSLVFSLFFTTQVDAFDRHKEKMYLNVFYGEKFHAKSIERYFGELRVGQMGISFDYPLWFLPVHSHISYIGESVFFQGSTLKTSNQYLKTNEIRSGYRKYVYPINKTSVFLGLGLSLMCGRLVAKPGSSLYAAYQSDSRFKIDLGTYIELGGHYQMTNWWHVGAKVDYSSINAKLFGKRVNLGGVTPSLYTGISF